MSETLKMVDQVNKSIKITSLINLPQNAERAFKEVLLSNGKTLCLHIKQKIGRGLNSHPSD